MIKSPDATFLARARKVAPKKHAPQTPEGLGATQGHCSRRRIIQRFPLQHSASPEPRWLALLRRAALLFVFLPSAAWGLSDAECLECHSDKALKREEGARAGMSVHVPGDALKGTPHEGVECVSCHADVKEVPHEPQLKPAACGGCHQEVEGLCQKDLHGQARARGDEDAPTCGDCHGSHQIRPRSDPESQLHPKHLPYTCARCHADLEVVRRHHINVPDPLKAYEQSAHFRASQEGQHAAVCSDCHGSHQIHKASDPEASIYRTRVPQTCGKCHGEVLKVYEQSVHGTAVARGVTGAPVCTDCHGEHAIKGKDDPTSSIYPKNISETTCVRCHADVRMVSKYGLAPGRLSSYEESYHGLAVKGGSTVAANCASCHGMHDILPSENPESTIHPSHLAQTCGKCHPNAGASFTKFPVHAGIAPNGEGERAAGLVRTAYLWMIALTIGGMAAHNGVILYHHLLRKLRRRRGERLHVRFTPYEVIQHYALALSFMTLVITGFALKFPDAFWVRGLSWLGLEEAVRRVVHRAAGVLLIAQSVIQAVWFVATRRGRGEVVSLLPRVADVQGVIQNLRYHLGLEKSPPQFDRYSYVEKAEYLALIWGTGVMAVTGLILWFPVAAAAWLPSWGVKVAEVIHYYEAWLATLAILVWHFFFVMFHPGEYPMSATWIDGKITEEEFRHHHPQEHERLKGGKAGVGGEGRET